MYFTGAGLVVKRLDLINNELLPDLLGALHFSPYFLATSPDGLIIAGNDRNRVLIWDLDSVEPIQILEPTFNTLRGLHFVGNDILVAIDYDGNIIQWDRWSWEEISRTELHREQKRAIFLPSGLILDDVDGVLPVVDFHGRPISSIELPTRSYRFISVSENGKELLIQVTDGVTVLDIETGEEVSYLELQELRNVAITPDWRLLIAGDADLNVHIIDFVNRNHLLTTNMDGTTIRSMAISPSGDFLGIYIIGPESPRIEVWGLLSESSTE
jgi:WD40 repeat protein